MSVKKIKCVLREYCRRNDRNRDRNLLKISFLHIRETPLKDVVESSMSDEYIAKLVRKAVDVNTLPDTTPTSTQIRNIHSFLSNPQYVDTGMSKWNWKYDYANLNLHLNSISKDCRACGRKCEET